MAEDKDLTASGINRLLGQGVGGVLTLGMKAGRWGVVGLGLAALGKLVAFIWPTSPRFDNLDSFLTYAGATLALWGIQSHAKRATDLAVTVAAESKLDKTALAVGAVVLPTSADPAVQHEINKRVRASSGS